MLTRRETVALAPGINARFVWAFPDDHELPDWAIPTGVLIEHPHLQNGWMGWKCVAHIRWVGDDAFARLISLQPLTIAPAFTCTSCGATGIIEDGKWRSIVQ